MDKVDSSLCAYEALADRTHAFTFSQGSREAVQAFAYQIEQLQLNRQWYGKGQLYLLVDARGAVSLPVRYLFEILSDYNREYPDLEPPRLTLAYLRSPDMVILDSYHMMAELLSPPLTIQFFIEEDHAKRWLAEAK
ncbi:MAG: hypothetical protein AAF846_11660 [Chloroflexota bacterium]